MEGVHILEGNAMFHSQRKFNCIPSLIVVGKRTLSNDWDTTENLSYTN